MSNYTYLVTNKINNKFYIGSHSWTGEGIDSNYYGSGKIIKQAVNKYGKDNFTVEVLYFYDTEEECRADEERILTEYDMANNPLAYNIKNSAVGWNSKDMKERWQNKEYRNKRIESTKKAMNRLEVKEKLSKIIKELWQSEELKDNHRKTMKEVMNKPEMRKKISEALNKPEIKDKCSKIMKEVQNKPEVILKKSKSMGGKPFVAIKDGKVKIFTSQSECARQLGICQSGINKCLNGKRKSSGGYIFKHIEQLESGIYEDIL